MTFFKEKISIFTPKISDDHFLVVDHVFLIFPIFSRFFISLLHACTCNVVCDPSSREKPLFQKYFFDETFFTLFMLLRASELKTLLLKILGGRMHGPFPHLKFFGGTVPQSSLGLRPWLIRRC